MTYYSEHRAARLAYQKAHAAKNAALIAARRHDQYLANAPHLKAKARARYLSDPGKVKMRCRGYKERQRTAISAQRRRRYLRDRAVLRKLKEAR